MGQYSDEPDIEISKLDIAKTQLEDAIDLFLSGKRISAITLRVLLMEYYQAY